MKIIKYNTKQTFKILFFFIIVFFLQISLGFIFIDHNLRTEAKKSLEDLSERIKSDLKYTDGKWDIRLYTADPYTPFPTGSSGFTAPLYILSADGFVIERNKPINGFLDSSDFKHLLIFQEPQTITTATNETWRILTMPLKDNDDTIGEIMVSYYGPPKNNLEEIDLKLKSSITTIKNYFPIKNKQINAELIDIRNIPYDVSFEVVDKYNRVLSNNGRIPTFLDPSYVTSLTQSPQKEQTVTDSITGEKFLIKITPITENSNTVGVIVAGKAEKPINQLLRTYLSFSVATSLALIVLLSIPTAYILRREIKTIQTEKNHGDPKIINQISFDLKQSIIVINEERIQIPYGSNQYSLCKLVFSNIKKRWESDEILEEFGENISGRSTRKIYDAMMAINKKTNTKLITYSGKTYQINPELKNLVV